MPEAFAEGVRLARDSSGRQYETPAGTTWKGWKRGGANSDHIEQNFRSSAIDPNDFRQFDTKKGPISAHKVVNSSYEIYTSDSFRLKPKQLNSLNQTLDDVYRLLGNPTENRPVIIIVPYAELNQDSIATYNSVQNTVRIFEGLLTADKGSLASLQKDGTCPTDRRSTLLHEMIHWQDAQEYQRHHGQIKSTEDSARYLAWAREKGQKEVERLVESGYNIYDISPYASAMIDRIIPQFDEVYTEYRTKRCLVR